MDGGGGVGATSEFRSQWMAGGFWGGSVTQRGERCSGGADYTAAEGAASFQEVANAADYIQRSLPAVGRGGATAASSIPPPPPPPMPPATPQQQQLLFQIG